jgi:hypothetical protein
MVLKKKGLDESKLESYSITPAPEPIHSYFTAAAALGNEIFYIIFFPILFWCA